MEEYKILDLYGDEIKLIVKDGKMYDDATGDVVEIFGTSRKEGEIISYGELDVEFDKVDMNSIVDYLKFSPDIIKFILNARNDGYNKFEIINGMRNIVRHKIDYDFFNQDYVNIKVATNFRDIY